MHTRRLLVQRAPIVALVCSLAGASLAQVPATDAAVEKLLDQVAQVSPELAEAKVAAQVERARVPQAGALADPTLSLGIQNDGFKRINIGKMETSWLTFMVTQPLFWPGKRGLREQVASLDVRRAEARLQRVVLALDASVRRAWLDVALSREQIELLGDLENLWSQAEKIARVRYEAGRAPQSDVLRAQLELARIQQRKWSLDADLVSRLAEVNRLRVQPLAEPVLSVTRIAVIKDPVVPGEPAAVADAESRSPELLLATLGVEQAGVRTELARKEKLPDFSVSAAIMPRGGLEPMWQLGFNIGLPIFAGRKQDQAVTENERRRIGEQQGAEAIRQMLRLRTHQRLTVLAALVRTNQRYREGVLPLSDATTRSVLAQYEVGQLPFASVLEALGGYVGDRGSYLASVADAQRIVIAQRELTLDAMPTPGAGSSGGAGLAGSGAGGATGSKAGTSSSATTTTSSGM